MNIIEKVVSAIIWLGKTFFWSLASVVFVICGAFLIDFLMELENEFIFPGLIIATAIIIGALIIRDRAR